MSQLFTDRTTCRLCAGSNLQVVFPMRPIPQGDGYTRPEDKHHTDMLFPHDIKFCPSCGNVQTGIDVDQKFIYDTYIWTTGISPGLSKSYELYAADLAQRFGGAGSRPLIVELGCNDGTFMGHLATAGFRVVGVDPAKNLGDRLRATGAEVVTAYFDKGVARDLKAQHGQPNIVVANHMLANINDLDVIIDGVKELLDDGGVFIGQVFYLYDVVKDNLLENFNHEHPSYLYVRTVRAWLERNGFEMFDAVRVSTKGGSLRFFAQKKGANRRPVSPSIAEFVGREEAAGLHLPATYGSLTRHVADVGAKLRQILGPYAQAGKPVGAYGTSIGATVFMYQYQIGEMVSFFVDDDKSRPGLVSPGYHIPVYTPDALYERKPPVVLCTAPLYSDQIIAKHQRYLDEGGQFVLFRPTVKIITRDGARDV